MVRYYSPEEQAQKSGLCREAACTEHEHDDAWIFAGDYQRIPALKNIIEAKFKVTFKNLKHLSVFLDGRRPTGH